MNLFSNEKEEVEVLEIEPKKPRKSKRIKKSEMSADALLDKSFVEPENKLGIFIGTMISIIILILIVFFVNYISDTDVETPKKEPSSSTNEVITNKEEVDNTVSGEQSVVGEYKEEFGSIFLYKDEKLGIVGLKQINNELASNFLGMYNCQTTDCNLYTYNDSYIYDFDNKTIVINDSGKFIYNYETSTLLTYKYDSFKSIKALDKYYLVAVSESDKTSNLYSLKGNKITTDDYQELGLTINNELKGYDDNVILAKKNDKWGLITIRTNEVIIDFNWDSLYLTYDNLYIAVQSDEYFVLNSDAVQQTEEGYPLVIEAFSEFFIMMEENNLHIKNYKGDDLIETPLEVGVMYDRYDELSGVTINKKNIVELEIIIIQSDGTLEKYIFNTASYTLEQTE